ncbi:hypothetical protein [Megalodesulfovibrio paquesii]
MSKKIQSLEGLVQTKNPPKVVAAPANSALPVPEASAGRLYQLSVKVPDSIYTQLKIAGVKLRRTNQDILVEALQDWLARNG